MKIENAHVTNVSLTMADHGVLSFWLSLEGDGWGCGFGGYVIGKGYLGAKEFTAKNGDGLEAMMRIMDVVGVERWEDIKGKYVRVMFDSEWGSRIDIIGNLIRDKWFNVKEFFAIRQMEMRGGNDDN